jgi:integrase
MTETRRQRGRPPGTGLGGRTRYLSDDELRRYFAAIKSKRDRVLFSLILYFGLRAKEAAELQLTDFDYANLQVKVRGVKGGLTRVYDQVPDSIWRLVRAWLKERRAHPMNPYIFPHRFKPTAAATAVWIEGLFRKICAKAGISGHSVHDLRHTRGRQLALMNFSAARIARHLRQRSSSSSDRYIDLSEDREVAEKIASAWPGY